MMTCLERATLFCAVNALPWDLAEPLKDLLEKATAEHVLRREDEIVAVLERIAQALETKR